MGYKAAIFDMDGTILDTVADLRDALNHTFRDFDHRSDFSEDEVKLFFGSGAAVAIRRAGGGERISAGEAGADRNKGRAAPFRR